MNCNILDVPESKHIANVIDIKNVDGEKSSNIRLCKSSTGLA